MINSPRIPHFFRIACASLAFSASFYYLFRPQSGEALGDLTLCFFLTFLVLGVFPVLSFGIFFQAPFFLNVVFPLKKISYFTLAILLILLIAWVGSAGREIQSEYPLWRSALNSSKIELLFYESAYFFYYLGWEGFFRGALLFALIPFGKYKAIIFQAVLSTLLHWGKPWPELMGAFPFGLGMGFLALQEKSIFSPLILHYLLGVSTDLFIRWRF